MINWGTICLNKEKGGLGIHNLSNFNKALLGKWNWRFIEEENSVCRVIISLKFGKKDGGWFSNTPRGNYGVGLWKDICKEATQLLQNCSLEVSDGCKVIFWEDACA